jgi:hypothetical protein
MTASPTMNAIVRPADIAAATKATNRIRSTMLIRARAPAGAAGRAMSSRDDGAGYANGQRRGKTPALLTLRQFRHR